MTASPCITHYTGQPMHYTLHSNNGALATSQMQSYPLDFHLWMFHKCFINVLIIWRQRKVITKLWSGPRGASLIATPTVITCYLLLSKWNFHVCSRSLLSSAVTLGNFSIIHIIIIVTQSWCWNNSKLFTECINNEHGYEKNTNYVNWNGSVLYSIKV